MTDAYAPSPALLALLKEFEQGPKGGFAARPYRCPAGVMTVGFGHAITPADAFRYPLTAAQADALLAADLSRFEPAVDRAVKVPVTPAMFDALVAFAFNVGEGALRGSTLLRKLNRRDYQGAADQFLIWNKATDPKTGRKVTLKGLTRRREAERALFLSGGMLV